ncbi:hypothetical protein BDV28DRAFT_161600 [Aspergillus coremiiformis]|uniref:Uncharacterized protein n=1 Tax=Aspergillus coremiiformis TaxID=138285 RepID=A0A5N6YRU9_9EURO|nr:hypothetical protein BDV28DRAFT_161600 [Aspergillus coremiiformis]
MIDSPGFSLIRRRSLLTRPGIATRRSLRDAAHRYPSSIGQEFESSFNRAGESNQPFQWPLTNCDDTVLDHTDPLAQIRPSTPTDFEYTHLGALKLGSLRVVNGSASPCPSDHSWLRPCSPTAEVSTTHIKDIRQGRDHLAQIDPTGMAESNPSGRRNHCSVLEDSWGTGAMPVSMYSGPGRSSNRTSSNNGNVRRPFKSKPSTSILRIPPFTAIMKHEDYPASPFSFEKSPTIAMSHGIYSTEAEDEAISVSDDEIPLDSQRTGSQEGPSLKRSPHSHRKVDSGYSSAASVRSLQDSHTRVSMDSQESAQRPCRYRRFTLGGSKDPDMCNVQSQSELSNQLPANRHLSLQGPRTGPRSGSNSWKTNMSTMCHEKEQLWAGERPRSLSVASPQDSGRMLPLPRYCAELRHYGSASYDAPLLSVHRPGTAAIQISGDTISNIQPCESLTAHKPGSGCGINTTGCKGLEATNRWITGADLGSDLFHKINPPRSKSTKESLKNTLHVRYDEDPEAVGASAAVQCLESEIEALLVPTSQVP